MVVTRDSKRLEAVKFVFEWFTTEAPTTNKIATVLNGMIKPMSGRKWTHRAVDQLLTSPYYKGVIATGRESQAEFWKFSATGLEPVEWHKNEAVVGGKNLPG